MSAENEYAPAFALDCSLRIASSRTASLTRWRQDGSSAAFRGNADGSGLSSACKVPCLCSSVCTVLNFRGIKHSSFYMQDVKEVLHVKGGPLINFPRNCCNTLQMAESSLA